MHHPTEKYISAITDALIRIAEHPEKRKKYSFVIQTGERTDECFFYKNDPMISCAEQFGLALLQAYELIKLPKPQRAKKNSFDQLYLDAENGDRESRRKLADAYRNGIGVRANARLADWWDQWK